MTRQRPQQMQSSHHRAESSCAEPLDEKTPTSMYVPTFISSIRALADPGPEPSVKRDARSGHISRDAGNSEPSVVIAPELTAELWCDGVADTVGIVRCRRSRRLGRGLIAILCGLFAICAGILLAGLARGRCSMRDAHHPQSSARGSSSMQQRSNTVQP